MACAVEGDAVQYARVEIEVGFIPDEQVTSA
jgi:hypothetical protein